MSEIDDTNISANGGIGELIRVRKEAREILSAGGMLTPEGVSAVLKFDRALRSRGVSPKGSGVILSCAVLVRELVKMRLTRSGYDE